MLMCPACGRGWGIPLCDGCAASLRTAPARRISQGGDPGVVVRAAYLHTGAARTLVHRLKYDGSAVAGALLATAMAPLVPEGTAALVPVPRATLRRLRYGIDPAVRLASLLGRRLGIPMIAALRPHLWWHAHAGARRTGRGAVQFRRTSRVPPRSVLVDDVLTTGATLLGARTALGDGSMSGVVATLGGTLTPMESAAPRTGGVGGVEYGPARSSPSAPTNPQTTKDDRARSDAIRVTRGTAHRGEPRDPG